MKKIIVAICLLWSTLSVSAQRDSLPSDKALMATVNSILDEAVSHSSDFKNYAATTILYERFAAAAVVAFPDIDSLERYINRYVRNSAVEAFTNLRMNTALNGILDFVRSAGSFTNASGSGDTLITSSGTIKRIIAGANIIITPGANSLTIESTGGGGTANLDSSRNSTSATILAPGTDAILLLADIGSNKAGLLSPSFALDLRDSVVTRVTKTGDSVRCFYSQGVLLGCDTAFSLVAAMSLDAVATNTIALDNDQASPGPDQGYRTNSSGVKGWYPVGGATNTALTTLKNKDINGVERFASTSGDPRSYNELFHETFNSGTMPGTITNSAGSTTITFSNGVMNLVGGSLSDELTHSFTTKLNRYTVEVEAIIGSLGATDYFIFGVKSSSGGPIWCQVKNDDLSGYWQHTSSSFIMGTTVGQGATAIGDRVIYRLKRDNFTYTFEIQNVTQGTFQSDTYEYTNIDVISSLVNPLRDIQVILKPLLGTISIDNVRLLNTERVYPDYLILGNSISEGFNSVQGDSTFYERLQSYFPHFKFSLFAKSGSQMSDFVNTAYLTQILEQQPKNVIIIQGINEVQNSILLATFLANLEQVIDTLEAHGINVIVANMTRYNAAFAASTAAYNTAINSAYDEINIYDSLGVVGSYSVADSLHPNTAGHRRMFAQIRDRIQADNIYQVQQVTASNSGLGIDGVKKYGNGDIGLGGETSNSIVITQPIGKTFTITRRLILDSVTNNNLIHFGNQTTNSLYWPGGGTTSTDLGLLTINTGAWQIANTLGTKGLFMNASGNFSVLGSTSLTATTLASTAATTVGSTLGVTGQASFNNVGTTWRARADGTTGNDYSFFTTSGGAAQLANVDGTRGWLFANTGNISMLGNFLLTTHQLTVNNTSTFTGAATFTAQARFNNNLFAWTAKGNNTTATDWGFQTTTGGAAQLSNLDGTVGFLVKADTDGSYFGGDFGFGTTSPAYKLDVVGTSSFAGRIRHTGTLNIVSPTHLLFKENDSTISEATALPDVFLSSNVATLTGSQTLTNKSLTSPTLTGTPIAPTAAPGTNTTQIATTAFVLANSGAPLLSVVGADPTDWSAAVSTMTILPDLTGLASHTVTLPSAATHVGRFIIIRNLSSDATFKWTFASTVHDNAGATVTNITDQTTIIVLADGTQWVIIN